MTGNIHNADVTKPFTSEQREAIAKALLAARPQVIQGTRVIIDPVARLAWYSAVTALAEVVCRGAGVNQDRIHAAHFFDTCGVPD